MSRTFKLRNGMTIQEAPEATAAATKTNNNNGFIDDYKVVNTNDIGSWTVGEWVCLDIRGDGMPVGGAHGPDFDIVEEIESD